MRTIAPTDYIEVGPSRLAALVIDWPSFCAAGATFVTWSRRAPRNRRRPPGTTSGRTRLTAYLNYIASLFQSH